MYATWQQSTAPITAVASQILTSPLAERQEVALRSASGTIYVGPDSAVTSATGMPITATVTKRLPLSPEAEIWAVTAAGSLTLIIAEFA
jgi:hypothetical protein